MNNLQILTQIFIETLKDFNNNKQPLTVDSLYMALFAKRELSAILCNTAVTTSLITNPVSKNYSSSNNSMYEKCYLHVTQVRNRFMDILDTFTPLLDNDDDTKHFNMMKKIVIGCTTLDILLSHGVDILYLMNMLIENTIRKINYTNDFLTELSKDLTQMEKHLLSYQTYNNDIHSNDNAFSDVLLSHTKDMNHILGTNKRLSEVRSFIVSKLSIIAESIEKKRHDDELKLKAAEERMNELQNSLRTYGDEILQVKERANTLEKEVLLDPLMGISNRRGYELQIRESLRRYHRHQEAFGLILMDVDDLKTVNDTYGHQAGDRCLLEIAKAISFCLRKTDFLARYGGDEIIAILPGAVAGETRKIAEKIRMCIERTVFWHNQEHFSVTMSIGVAAVMATDEEPGSLFARVDSAIYEAKKCGRNRTIAG